MSDHIDLEERLAGYGQVLSAELTSWPAFNPAAMAASSPLPFLRGWRGRWSGAGHRPLFATVLLASLVVAASVVAALSLTVGGGSNTSDQAVVDTAAAAAPAELGEPSTAEAGASDADSSPGGAVAAAEGDPDAGSPAPVGEIDDTDPPAATDGGSEPSPGDAGEPVESAPSARCRDGVLVGDQCRIATPVSREAKSAACTAQDGTLTGSTGGNQAVCLQLVDPVAVCPGAAEVQGFLCLVRSPPAPMVPACPAEANLVGQRCLRILEVEIGCDEGELVDDLCRVEGTPAQGGELVCTTGTAVDGRCTVVIAGTCSTGTPASNGCVTSAPTEKRVTCPTDTVLRDGRCQPPEGCENTKDSRVCGSPPDVEVVCSLTGQRGGDCSTTVPATCPANYRWTGTGCARETVAAPSPFGCAAGELLVGTSCFAESDPVSLCDEGQLVEPGSELAGQLGVDADEDVCVITQPAVPAPPACSPGAALEAGRCVSAFAAATTCAVGVAMQGACEVVIEIDEAGLCDAGAVHESGWCVRYEDPVTG